MTSIAHMPDCEKSDRIEWTPETVAQFIDLWNTRHPNFVADHFGISRGYAYARASMLRSVGVEMKLYNKQQRTEVTESDRAAMDMFAKALACKYRMAVSSVVGNRRIRDGRLDARNALAWAGVHLLSMSCKQVAMYFNRTSHSTAIWMSRHAKQEDKDFCTGLFRSKEMRRA